MFGFLRRFLGNRSPPSVPEPDNVRPEAPLAVPSVIKEQWVIDDQLAIVGPRARVIVDVGTHDGATTAQYLETFPEARVFGFEASAANAVRTRQRLAAFGDRVKIIEKAVSGQSGRQTLHINFHDGSHSLLPLGDTRYFAGKVAEVDHVAVESTTLDDFAALESLERIDILAMDIQGGELDALKGAGRLLKEGRVGLITLEVEFQQLYRDQPLFWDIGRFLHGYGYGFYRLHQVQPHLANPRVLCWADAIFLGPEHLAVPSPAT
jgi:FkbM family methyltransferase